MFVMILDDLIAFTCILRIYEGSGIFGRRSRLHWFHPSRMRMEISNLLAPRLDPFGVALLWGFGCHIWFGTSRLDPFGASLVWDIEA